MRIAHGSSCVHRRFLLCHSAVRPHTSFCLGARIPVSLPDNNRFNPTLLKRSLNPQILTCGRNVSSQLLLRFECGIHRNLPDVLFIVRVLADHTSLRDSFGTRFGNRPEIVHELVLYHVSANQCLPS